MRVTAVASTHQTIPPSTSAFSKSESICLTSPITLLELHQLLHNQEHSTRRGEALNSSDKTGAFGISKQVKTSLVDAPSRRHDLPIPFNGKWGESVKRIEEKPALTLPVLVPLKYCAESPTSHIAA